MKVIVRNKDQVCCDTIPANDLKIGQMAVIAEKEWTKQVVIRTYMGLVSLTDPLLCWPGDYRGQSGEEAKALPNFEVRVIKSTEEVILHQGVL